METLIVIVHTLYVCDYVLSMYHMVVDFIHTKYNESFLFIIVI